MRRTAAVTVTAMVLGMGGLAACGGGGVSTVDTDDYAQTFCDAIETASEAFDDTDMPDVLEDLDNAEFGDDELDEDDGTQLLEDAATALDAIEDGAGAFQDEVTGSQPDDGDAEEFMADLTESIEGGLEKIAEAKDELAELTGDDVADDPGDLSETLREATNNPVFEVLFDNDGNINNDYEDIVQAIGEECDFFSGE